MTYLYLHHWYFESEKVVTHVISHLAVQNRVSMEVNVLFRVTLINAIVLLDILV